MSLDTNTVFSALLGIVCTGLGWWLRFLWDAQIALQRDLAELEARLPETYVRRDDFKDIVTMLSQRFDRLEQKLDDLTQKRN